MSICLYTFPQTSLSKHQKHTSWPTLGCNTLSLYTHVDFVIIIWGWEKRKITKKKGQPPPLSFNSYYCYAFVHLSNLVIRQDVLFHKDARDWFMSCANVNVVYLQIALNKDYIIYDYLPCSIFVRDYD